MYLYVHFPKVMLMPVVNNKGLLTARYCGLSSPGLLWCWMHYPLSQKTIQGWRLKTN